MITIKPITTVREGKEARAFCLKIIKEIYGYDYNPAWHNDLDALGKPSSAYASAHRGVFYIALKGSSLIGTIALRDFSTHPLFLRFQERYGKGSVASVWRCCIAPKERGKGLGTLLCNVLHYGARELAYDHLYLHTSLNNPLAVQFWQNQGFTPFLKEPHTLDKTIHMDKPL